MIALFAVPYRLMTTFAAGQVMAPPVPALVGELQSVSP